MDTLNGIIGVLNAQPQFEGLSVDQLKTIAQYVELVNFSSGENGDLRIKGNELFILLSGRVEAMSRPNEQSEFGKSSEYGPGEVLNIFKLIDSNNTIKISRVLEATTCLNLDVDSLEKDKDFEKIHSLLLKNCVKQFSDRLSYIEKVLIKTGSITTKSIQAQLKEVKEKMLFGMFVIRIILILCLYTISLKGLELLEIDLGSPAFVSALILIIISFFVYKIMLDTNQPLSDFGFTTMNARRSIKEGLFFALVLFLLMLIFKLFMIDDIPQFRGIPLFDFETGINSSLQITSVRQLSFLLVYMLFAPIQELIVRGGLQSSLYRFLVGSHKKKTWVSIFVSNIIFIAFHSHISILFSIFTFFPGIVWGWLYSRHRTLIGVSISHMLLGFLVLFLLGVDKITIIP